VTPALPAASLPCLPACLPAPFPRSWNRLIDELRCVWAPKCAQPYVEVGASDSWAGYGYRRRLSGDADGARRGYNASTIATGGGWPVAGALPPSPLEEPER
jgi:hypothetical protein